MSILSFKAEMEFNVTSRINCCHHIEKSVRDLVFFLEKNKIRELFPKSKFNLFFLYFLLLQECHRDAYLVDGCFVAFEDIISIVSCLCDALFEYNGTSISLVVIALGHNQDDTIIVRSDILNTKINDVSNDWIGAPVIVDINGQESYICKENDVHVIQSNLKRIFQGLQVDSKSFSIIGKKFCTYACMQYVKLCIYANLSSMLRFCQLIR